MLQITDYDDIVTGGISIQQAGVSKPKVQEISSSTTDIHFTAYRYGQVVTCISDAAASSKSLRRYSLEIQEIEIVETISKASADQNNEEMDHHLSIMEEHVLNLRSELEFILQEAEFHSEWEAAFQKEIIGIHEEAGWWPIFHIIILIVAGFMQAQHIVSFFKMKHLI